MGAVLEQAVVVSGSGWPWVGSVEEVAGSGRLVVGSGKVVAGSGRVVVDSVEVVVAEWVEQELVLVLDETAGAVVLVLASEQSGIDALAVMAVAVVGAAVVMGPAVGASAKTVGAGAVLSTVPSAAAGQECRSKGCTTEGILVAGGLGCSTSSTLTWSLGEHRQRHTKGFAHNPVVLVHLC